MEEKPRPIYARAGALGATALLAVSGAFIAGPATADDSVPPTEATAQTTDSSETRDDATASPKEAPSPSGQEPEQLLEPAAVEGEIPRTPTLDVSGTKGSVWVNMQYFGSAPGATEVLVTMSDGDGNRSWTETTDDKGTFGIRTPERIPEGGKITISLQGVNGEAKSEVATYVFAVKETAAPQPEFTGTGDYEGQAGTITGTAVANALVTVTINRSVDRQASSPGRGPESYPVTAGADGVWTLTLEEPLSYGVHNLSAVQETATLSETPFPITRTINVYPGLPVFLSPGNGSEIPVNRLPSTITGTAAPGANVLAVVDAEAKYEADPTSVIPVLETVADANGNWSLPLSELALGQHVLLAYQYVAGMTSDVAEAEFTVTPAVADPVAVNPIPVANPGTGNAANLAATGAQNVGLLAAGGATLLVAGAGALFLTKRRRTVADS